MSEIELKPCPFCGGEAYLEGDLSDWWVQCKCGVETHSYQTKEEAISFWNTRKPMERIVEQLEEAEQHCLENSNWQGQSAFDKAIEIVKAGGVNE